VRADNVANGQLCVMVSALIDSLQAIMFEAVGAAALIEKTFN
jgi:hypothetical protein